VGPRVLVLGGVPIVGVGSRVGYPALAPGPGERWGEVASAPLLIPSSPGAGYRASGTPLGPMDPILTESTLEGRELEGLLTNLWNF